MPHRPLPSLDIDLSAERDETLDTMDDEPDLAAGPPEAAEVVLAAVRLSTVDWFLVALRAWIGVLGATLIVAPLAVGVVLAILALARLGWAAIGL